MFYRYTILYLNILLVQIMIRQCHSVAHVLLLRCVSYFLLLTFKLKRFVCKPPTTLIIRHPFNHATDLLLLCCHSLMCHIVSYHVCNLTIRPTGMSLLCMHIKIALHKNFGQVIPNQMSTKSDRKDSRLMWRYENQLRVHGKSRKQTPWSERCSAKIHPAALLWIRRKQGHRQPAGWCSHCLKHHSALAPKYSKIK